MSKLHLVRSVEREVFAAVAYGFELMSRHVATDEATRELSDIIRSAMVTDYVQRRLCELPCIRRAPGPRAEFVLSGDGDQLVFRVHRARLSKRRKASYDAQALSPTMNAVTSGPRQGTFPDVLFLWVAEDDQLLDVWAVSPIARPRAEAGTQRAEFRRVRGKCWDWDHRLPRVAATPQTLDALAPDPIHQEVDLPVDQFEERGAAEG